ncbi:MAG: tyrosine-type recombinase/integrase, partial [Candidatus Methylomirabilaceae bacterium]
TVMNARSSTVRRERGLYFRLRKFGTQKHDGRRGDWWICYADQYGRIHHEKVGARTLALEAYRKRKTEVREGTFFPQKDRPKPILFSQLAADFLKHAQINNKRSYRTDELRMRRLLEKFGDREAESVTAEEIEQFKGELTTEKKLKPATVNRHLALMKTIYSVGIRHKKVTMNPVRLVTLYRENNKRVRYLTDEEQFRLFRSLPERYHPIVEVGLLTGLRAGNLIGLRWREVDLDVGVYTIPESKSGDPLRLPMHSRVKEILSSLPRNGIYVFAEVDGQPPWDFTHTFADAVRRAGIHDLHLHDLRHTWASRMAMAGVDLRTIQTLGGWKTLQMVERYTHLSPDHTRQAIERLQIPVTIIEDRTQRNEDTAGRSTQIY